MTSTKPETTKDKTPKEKKTRPPTQSLGAMDKAQAVLAVWTERCKPADVCRQFKINWMTFNHWQRRALEGMLQALESRVNLARGQVLSPRLQALLQRQERSLQQAKLSRRLEQLQQNKVARPPADLAKTS
jgi:hypothetical protein